MRRLIITLCLTLLLTGGIIAFNTLVSAKGDSCTEWSKQFNGCSQRVCTDSKGKMYCEEICPGEKVARRIKC